MDVIILGGGIVGFTLANILARNSDLKIALIDPNKPILEWDDSIYDARCSAITAATQQAFVDIGIWQEILNVRAGIYEQMLVWDQDPAVRVHFSAAQLGVNNLGHIIENRIILRALFNKLSTHNNVEIIYNMAETIEFNNDFVRVDIAGRSIDCKLVIGADGVNSWLRRKAEIAIVEWDYQHSALVATIKSQLPHNNTASQRFMPDGPLAFLPLQDSHLSSIVWSSNPEKIAALMQLESTEFCQQLAAEFADTLGVLELQSDRKSFPLRMLHAEQYVAARLALVGDAAHVVHPLAGQGLNLGIQDAVVLAEVIQQACLQRQDFGKLSILRKYERNRKGHNISMLALIEAIKRVFAVKHKAFTSLRFGGMHCVNSFNFIKNTMMKFAMGV